MKRYLLMIAVFILAAGAAVVIVESMRSKAPPSQVRMYELASTSPQGRFRTLPKAHTVRVTHVDKTALDLLVGYIVKRGAPVVAEKAGNFDSKTGVIRILSEELRWEASLPEGMRPNFDHTLRHEYGHAFLNDFLKAAAGGDQRLAATLSVMPYQTASAKAADWPGALVPLLEEYRKTPKTVFGSAYYTSTFGEYFAESYARFCEGKEVPAATRKFFVSQLQ